MNLEEGFCFKPSPPLGGSQGKTDIKILFQAIPQLGRSNVLLNLIL
jgi:hypothetical protein